MVHHIEPKVILEPLCGFVFVCGEGYLADVGAAFHFDEPDFDGGLGIFGLGPARDEIKTPVFLLHGLEKCGVRS